jgi:hypothetical protein
LPIEHSLTQRRKFGGWQDFAYKLNRPQSKSTANLGELLIPEINRVSHQLISRVSSLP